MILEATRKQPIESVVEESGCLEWLAQRIADNSPGYFDVAHLTGHAHQTPDGPRFILENEIGGRYDADARQIADAFQGRCPWLYSFPAVKPPSRGRRERSLPSQRNWSMPGSPRCLAGLCRWMMSTPARPLQCYMSVSRLVTRW